MFENKINFGKKLFLLKQVQAVVEKQKHFDIKIIR